jgi:hypothetical protein
MKNEKKNCIFIYVHNQIKLFYFHIIKINDWKHFFCKPSKTIVTITCTYTYRQFNRNGRVFNMKQIMRNCNDNQNTKQKTKPENKQ